MFGISLSVVASYAILRIFHYSQWLYLRESGTVLNRKFILSVNVFFAAFSVLIVLFLAYWGFKISWVQSLGLFLAGFLVTVVWQPVWRAIGLRGSDVQLTLLAFAIEPICGYVIWRGAL